MQTNKERSDQTRISLEYSPFVLQSLSQDTAVESPLEFQERLRGIGADMKRVRAALDAKYLSLKKAAFAISPDTASGYAALFEKYHMPGHAKKITESPALDTAKVKDVLYDLGSNLPEDLKGLGRSTAAGGRAPLAEFAALIGDRMPERITPMGFLLLAELVLRDAARGVDGFTEEPLKSSLTGGDSLLYNALEAHVPFLAERSCPPDFAAKVMKLRTEILASHAGAPLPPAPREVKTKALDQLLHTDPLQIAEKLTGSYREGPGVGLGLQLFFGVNAEKNKLLDELGDSKLCNKLDDYLRIVQSEGFELVHVEDFEGRTYRDGKPPYKEKYFIMVNREKGILLSFCTYGGDGVNGGNFYYNWEPDGSPECYRKTSSGGMVSPTVWSGDHDCREAFRFKIQGLDSSGRFLKKWVDRPFLWLVRYDEECEENRDRYDDIVRERIEKLPEDIRCMITPEPDTARHSKLEDFKTFASELGYTARSSSSFEYVRWERTETGQVSVLNGSDGSLLVIRSGPELNRKGEIEERISDAFLICRFTPKEGSPPWEWGRYVKDGQEQPDGSYALAARVGGRLKYHIERMRECGEISVLPSEVSIESFELFAERSRFAQPYDFERQNRSRESLAACLKS